MAGDKHLVIFVKAPRLGRVKTRLALDIGNLAAWSFYRNNTKRLLRRLGVSRRWCCWLAVTPDDAGDAIWPRHLVHLNQGAGDLGDRMANVFETLPAGPAIIVGSDVPGITGAQIARAFGELNFCDAVFGPAADGGYWLVGLGDARLARKLFQGVRWSTRHALGDTLANLGPGRRAALLDELADVDRGADLKRYNKYLNA